ncbi:S8 family serine peptidase [bacterium]|nr:S8 family serine peptidase [bacterium]
MHINSRTGLLITAMLAALAMAGCGGGSAPVNGDLVTGGQPALEANEQAAVPGTPTLVAGGRRLPVADADQPLPHATAQAGIDFAADRFVVIFENQPAAAALAPYLGQSAGASADALLATDNVPLVQHQYFRKVSANLAAKYGLALVSRVFYRDINFAVYQLPVVEDVADLDAAMLAVLNDNPGLVREVCYDFYVSISATPAPPELVDRLFTDRPAGFFGGTAPAPARGASTAPSYDNPDPYYQNKPGYYDSGDADYGRGSWGLWRMGATLDEAWSYTTGSSAVMVAVVDTGVRYTHEDLANCINPTTDPPYNGEGILLDVINKDNEPLDGHGHGTFCASEIGATANNAKGLAGVCWNVTILPVKVLSDSGYGSDSQVAEGMLLADYLGANILSMSLGGPFPDRTTQLAAQQCDADGMLVVVAAGNDNTGAPHYPGYYPYCLCVGATTLVNDDNDEDFSVTGGAIPISTRYDARATFSNYGDWVDIAAPGRAICGAYKNSNTSYIFGWQGTSMATPYVAGCAALLWGYIADPDKTEVRALLQASATEMTHHNDAANPTGFVGTDDNGTVRFCNVLEAIELYNDGDYPFSAPTISWNNPEDEDTVGGDVEIRIGVSGGSGTVRKVEVETYARQIGVSTALDNGYYRIDWDTTFEFNGELELIAHVYDDKANITTSSITVTTNNTRTEPPWSEEFTGLADNAIPTDWFEFDGNWGTTNTSWGADASQYPSGSSAPAMHTSGSTANYASYSNDWLYAPIIDLADYAEPSLTFQRRYQRNTSDYLYFLVTADDRTYGYLEFIDGTGLHDWDEVEYDLSAYAGQEIRLMWVLQANGSSNTVGMWIDDVEIAGATGAPPTIAITLPSNGATASGLVQVNITASTDTTTVKVNAYPPQLGPITYGGLSWTDNGDGTKSTSLYWDSRRTYNGGALLEVLVFDDEGFMATDAVSLAVSNSTQDPTWHEGFETITTLGGTSGSSFDGEWYLWSWGSGMWRIASDDYHTGSKCAKMGPADTGNYGDYEFDQMYGPIHDLSGAAHPYLRLWHKISTGGDTDDYGKILLVRYDGLDDIETPLGEFRTDTSGGWQRLLYDLSGFKDDPLRFNFLFISDAGTAGTGWFIDDYEIIDADPAITSISNNARGQAGDTRTITGVNFANIQDTSTVSFAKDGGGRTEVVTYNSWSDTAIEVVLPSDVASGNVIVTVLGEESDGEYFAVVLDPPVIDNLGQL